jgi:ATP-dependent Clp protease adaptor protein ClpS
MKVYLADKEKDGDGKGGGQTGVITRTQTRTKKPSLYKVLLLNDDYTPMEFVVHVLERFFGKGGKKRRSSCCMCIRRVSACAVSTRTRSPKPK